MTNSKILKLSRDHNHALLLELIWPTSVQNLTTLGLAVPGSSRSAHSGSLPVLPVRYPHAVAQYRYALQYIRAV